MYPYPAVSPIDEWYFQHIIMTICPALLILLFAFVLVLIARGIQLLLTKPGKSTMSQSAPLHPDTSFLIPYSEDEKPERQGDTRWIFGLRDETKPENTWLNTP